MKSDALSQRREVRYRGMVQGVGFRYATRRLADRFDVAGFVQNLSDGRVLVVAEGQSVELERFFTALEEELGRFISDKEDISGPPAEHFQSFNIRI